MSVNVKYDKQFLFGIFFLLIIILAVEMSLRSYEYIGIPCGIFENDAFSNLNYFEIKNAVEQGIYSKDEAVKLAKEWARNKIN